MSLRKSLWAQFGFWLFAALIPSLQPHLFAQDHPREHDTRRSDEEKRKKEQSGGDRLGKEDGKLGKDSERIAKEGLGKESLGKESEAGRHEDGKQASDGKENGTGNISDSRRRELEQLRERRAQAESEAKVEKIKSQSREERAQELGYDPATKKLRPDEARVGPEIEAKYGYFEREKSGQADWVSVSGEYRGKTFDLMGPPEGKEKHVDMAEFRKELDKHIDKVDYTVLETRNMTPEQKAETREYLKTKGKDEQAKVITLE